ncbi:MAG: transcriptional repressor [Clostridia bacterium]|nr:transcriptional repressor [Clostridia bacterium]
MPKYNTRQRKLLLDYLGKNADAQLTARMIADQLSGEGISISAVYRNLSELESEGKIRRINVGNSRESHFQYAGAECCRDQLHLSCNSCGKTYHMHMPDAQRLLQSVQQSEGFDIDKSQTILRGTCSACRKKAQKA